MPTTNNDRVLALSIFDGDNYVPVFFLQNDKIIPAGEFDIGTLQLPVRNIYANTVKTGAPYDPDDAATKQYVDAKPVGITKLQDDPNPILANSLLVNTNDTIELGAINKQFKKLFVGDIQSNTSVLWLRANNDGTNAGLLVFSVGQVFVTEIDYQTFKTHVPITPINNLGTSLGKADLRFNVLFAQNGDFSGTVKAAEPVEPTDLATRNYVDNKTLPLTPYQQGAASINFGVSHYNKELRGSFASAMNYVLPADAPQGTWFGLTNMTANPLTVSAGAGAIIHSKDGMLGVNGQYGRIYGYSDGAAWYISGDLI